MAKKIIIAQLHTDEEKRIALLRCKTQEKVILSDISHINKSLNSGIREPSKKIQDLNNELESKKSESLNTPWYKIFTHIKNYTERMVIKNSIAEQKGLIASLTYPINNRAKMLGKQLAALRENYIEPLEFMLADINQSVMNTKYQPDKDPEKQKTALFLFKAGEDLFKTFYDKAFVIYQERVANEKAGGPLKVMTPEEKLLASTRDLIGAALSHLKYPSNLTRETLERRQAGYNNALQNIDLPKEDDSLLKLKEFLFGVKSLDPKLNLSAIETMPFINIAASSDAKAAVITRLANRVGEADNINLDPVNRKSADFSAVCEELKSKAKNESDASQSVTSKQAQNEINTTEHSTKLARGS